MTVLHSAAGQQNRGHPIDFAGVPAQFRQSEFP